MPNAFSLPRTRIMCGRYTLRSSQKDLREAFPLLDVLEIAPRYNICPTQAVPVIRRVPDESTAQLAVLRWGFLAPWAKSPKDRPQPINAKSETAAGGRMFGPAFRT